MRSVIPKDRIIALTKPKSIYVICCFEQDYFCDGHLEGHCWRGFFSLYLQVAYGIFFAKNIGIPYRVNFGNLDYFYSDEVKFNGNRNFWEYYFHSEPKDNTLTDVINSKFENYPLRIWDRNFIKKIHSVVFSEFSLKEDISQSIHKVKIQFEGHRVLGIHIRRTDHVFEVQPVKIEVYFDLVSRKISNFDKLFIATDDRDILQRFNAIYQNKVIYNDCIRSSGFTPLHGLENKENGYLLGKQALIDCHSLALCDELILSPSNLSYCALLINPEITYSIAESWKSKINRWKTLGAYYLNKWGIRKW